MNHRTAARPWAEPRSLCPLGPGASSGITQFATGQFPIAGLAPRTSSQCVDDGSGIVCPSREEPPVVLKAVSSRVGVTEQTVTFTV